MRRWKRWAVGILAALFLAAAGTALLLWNGVILLNHPSTEEYLVRGVDVSSYQGEIDWAVLASQGISFAFIKATEGSSFTDSQFAGNWAQAQEQELRVGAYHFFSYDSPGKRQAAHFIETVSPCEGMLPPVVDIEFYGDKEQDPPARQEVQSQLDDLLQALESWYGVKPILYATEKSYDLYLAGGYEDYDIWIRNVITAPRLSDGRSWTFWQYTNRARLDGYNGKEKFIDCNVFSGTKEEFAQYGLPLTQKKSGW